MEQNKNKIINVELNIPNNVVTILSNINTQLNKIKDSTTNAKNAFSALGSHASAFNSLIKTIGILSIATVKASAFLKAFTISKTKLTIATRLLKSGTLTAAVATKKLSFATAAQTAIYAVMTKQIGFATAAQWLWNIAMTANPVGAVIVAIAALIAIVVGVIAIFRRFSRSAREHNRAVSDLSDQYGRSTEDIEADMERMGTTCTDTWRAVEDATQSVANRFGGCADTIRGEIADLVAEYGCYDLAIASWEATQMEALANTAAQWGVCANTIKDSLGEIDLDEWVAQQEMHLNELSDTWNMSSSDIQRELQEQGISMEEWAYNQETTLQNVATEWNMCSEVARAHMNEMGMSADEWSAHMGQAWDDFNADVSRNVDSIINGFREIPTEYEQSAEDLRAIMEANIATTEAWHESMSDISSRVGPEMLAWLESKGPEFNSVIQEMLECDYELEAWIDAFDRTTALATDEALNNIEDPAIHDAIVNKLDETGQAIANHTALVDGYETVINNATDHAVNLAGQGGQEVGTAFVDSATNVDYSAIPNTIAQTMAAGQASMVQPVEQAVTTMVNTVQDGMTSIQTTTATAFTGLGKQINLAMTSVTTIITTKLERIKQLFDQLSTTLQTSGNQAITATNNMATGMTSAMNGIDTRFRNIGRNIIDGLRDGVISREVALMATVDRIATNMQRTLQRALQINSPSRIMREKIGRFIPEGIGAGINKYADAAIGSVDQLAKDIININIPSVESMIGIGPSLNLASVGSAGTSNTDNSFTINNEGMFKGANFAVNNDQDIDRIMEQMAWKIKQEQMRLYR